MIVEAPLLFYRILFALSQFSLPPAPPIIDHRRPHQSSFEEFSLTGLASYAVCTHVKSFASPGEGNRMDSRASENFSASGNKKGWTGGFYATVTSHCVRGVIHKCGIVLALMNGFLLSLSVCLPAHRPPHKGVEWATRCSEGVRKECSIVETSCSSSSGLSYI